MSEWECGNCGITNHGDTDECPWCLLDEAHQEWTRLTTEGALKDELLRSSFPFVPGHIKDRIADTGVIEFENERVSGSRG